MSTASATPTNSSRWIADRDGAVATLLQEIHKQHPISSLSHPPHPLDHLTRLIPNERMRCDFLHRFVIARTGRYDDAATRVLHLCALLEQYPHLTIKRDAEIEAAMKLEFFRAFPPKFTETGAIQISIKMSKLDWDKLQSVEQAQKMWFYMVFVLIMLPHGATPAQLYPAQLQGLVGQGDASDAGPSNIKIAFQLFLLRAISHCLPVRLQAMIMFNPPFFVSWVAFPAIKVGMSKKLVDRVTLTDDEKVLFEKGAGKQLSRLSDHFKDGEWKPVSLPSEADLAHLRVYEEAQGSKEAAAATAAAA